MLRARSDVVEEALHQATALQLTLARELCAKGRVRGAERARLSEAAMLIVEAALILRRLSLGGRKTKTPDGPTGIGRITNGGWIDEPASVC